MVSESRYGLQVLYAAEEPEVDIVFVHGLFGRADETWTSNAVASELPASTSSLTSDSTEINENKGLLWPKELLPQAIPQSRIFTWGYDADINHLFSSASQNTVFQHAQILLSDLADNRITDEEKRRPLIFVAHSLGGIVVKDMLNASRMEVTYLKDILPATHGIVFLGTPHRGSTTATIGKIAQNITKLFLKNPNASILQDLEVNSQTLDRVGRGFSQILAERPIQVHSFREELPTNGIMVVEKFSSTIEHGQEVVSSIPANHRNMVKFSGPSDIGYRRVEAVLKRWHTGIRAQKRRSSHAGIVRANTAEIASLEIQIRDQLNPSDFQLELTQNEYERCPETGSWLLEGPHFSDFLSGHTGTPIFLCGGPGFGKTFLMSLIVDRLRDVLPDKRGTSLVYFFCDNKTEASSKRTALAIMRTFSAQLLDQIVMFNPKFVKDRLAAFAKVHQENRSAFGLFYVTVEMALKFFNLNYIIIDALNECDDWQEIIKIFQKLPASILATLRIILSSQDVFGIPHRLQQIQEVHRFDIDQHRMESDIAKYVSWRLQSLDTRGFGTHEDGVKILTEGSKGLFILAKMRLDVLENEILPYDGDMNSVVQKLPQEIFSYYERSLSRLTAQNLLFAKTMFEWIIYAQTPLTVRELGVACAEKTGGSPSHEQAKVLSVRGIENLGGGLVGIFDDRVELVHATARDFLTSYHWEEASIPDPGNNESAIHARMAIKCIDYLSDSEMVQEILSLQAARANTTEKYPFLTYATLNWLDHIRLSASKDRRIIDNVVQFFESNAGLAWWVQYASLIELHNWWAIPRLTSRFQEWSYQNPLILGTVHSPADLFTELYRKRVRLFQEPVSDEERPNYIDALIGLADNRLYYLEFDEAEKLHRKALDEAIKLPAPANGFWRIKVTLDMLHLFRSQGLFSQVRSLCDEVLASPEIATEANIRLYLGAQQLRADLENDLGHYMVAERMLQESLSLAMQVLDENDPDILAMRNSLAITYKGLGNVDEANKLIDVDYFELVLGRDHPSTLRGMGNVALFRLDQGKVQEGIDIARLVWKRWREISGPSSEATIAAGLDLASCLRARGLYDETLNYQQTMQKQVLEFVPANHFLALYVETEIAETLSLQGNSDLAIYHQTHVLSERLRQFGADHRWTVLAKSSLANLYQRHRDFKQAEKLIFEALGVMENDPDIAYTETCRLKLNLAFIKRKQSRLREAEELQSWVIEERRKYLHDASGPVLSAWCELARTKVDLGHLNEAEEIERMVLQERNKREEPSSPNIITAMNNLALTLQDLGKLDEAEHLQQQVLRAYQEYEETNSPNIFLAMRHLATTRLRKGQLNAREETELQILETYKDGEPDSPSRLEAVTKLAFIKDDLGKLAEADRLFNEVAEAYKRKQGDKGYHTLDAMSNLVWIKYRRGKLQEAESLATHVIAAQKETLGEESLAAVVTTVRLGRVKQAQLLYQDALILYRWVLEKRQQYEGENSEDVLNAKRDLAIVQQDLGNYEEAERLQLEVLRVREMTEIGDTSRLLHAIANLRSVKESQGKLDEAEALQMDLVKRWGKIRDETSSDVLEAKSDLASIKKQLGKWEEAEMVLTSVVKVHWDNNDRESPSLLQDIESLAWAKGVMRKLHEATKLQQMVVDMRQKTGDEDSPQLLNAINHLAAMKLQLGEGEEAERLQTRVIEIYRRNGRERSYDAMEVLADLAWTKKTRGKATEALEMQEKVVQFLCDEYSENSLRTLEAMKRLAELKTENGRFEEAKDLFKGVLKKMTDIGAGNSHHYMSTKAAYAITLRSLNDLAQAESIQQEVLETRTQLGEEDFSVLMAMSDLAHTKSMCGKFEECEILFEKVLAAYKKIENGSGPDMVIALQNVMDTKMDLGKWGEAKVLQEEILRLHRQNKHVDEETIREAMNELDLIKSRLPRTVSRRSSFFSALCSCFR